jgi:hypothetical protein
MSGLGGDKIIEVLIDKTLEIMEKHHMLDPSINNNPTPLFPCRNQGCAEEVSYHADMLAMHPNGGVVCEECWQEGQQDHQPDWSDLPPFLPQPQEKTNG